MSKKLAYYFNGKIDKESTEKFISFCNSNDGKFTLYLSSGGGENWCGEVIQDLINGRCKEIVALGQVSSCAFKIFFSAKCKKRIGHRCYGVFHQTTWQFPVGQNGRYEKDTEMKIENFKKGMVDDVEWCKEIGLTPKEIKAIKNNEDVYFDTERLNELIIFNS